MKKKKIKIFLAGYVNFQNAQNLNCKALSEHLDKTKFKIYTLLYPYNYKVNFMPLKDVHYYKLHWPFKIFRYLTYIKLFIKADIAYLPTGIDQFIFVSSKIFRTKIFNTLEGILSEVLIQKIGTKKFPAYLKRYKYCEPNLFAITKYIANTESKRHNLKFADEILYLGVESNNFLLKSLRNFEGLKNIIFIGNDPIRKNIPDFFEVSKIFPDIQFHIVGGNQLRNGSVEDYIKDNKLSNVIYHGQLDHTQLSKLLEEMDLMYFPSRSEGFPKVHLETACAGVPTLCYGDYGASEWINSWKNGIIVNTKEEAIDAIKTLQQNPDTLKELSINAIELGKSFDWSIMVKTWQEVIEKIVNNN